MADMANPVSSDTPETLPDVARTWEDVLKWHGVDSLPGQERQILRDFVLASTNDLLMTYGKDWFLKHRTMLYRQVENLATLI